MNVDDSNNDTQQIVRSKYFADNDMDESLTDFKEKKKNVIGPKSTKTTAKTKPKKRIKGQKDIRAVLNPKKNELVKYSEEFQSVCKKSGVDVDADQLQLVIAISKSLQTDNGVTAVSPKLSAQERNSKIRTTLQEYGFKIPQIKVANKKRVKKTKKEYQLLVKTDAEKRQIVSDRYSQVLLNYFEVFNKQSMLEECIPLYNIATNACYDVLKHNHIFYVDDLVEKSNTNGCLFKDYATIPGRPMSPKLLEDTKMDFSGIECSQEELDLVLSGVINIAKNIVKCKRKQLEHKVEDVGANSLRKDQNGEEIMVEKSINIQIGNHGIIKSNEKNMNCEVNKNQDDDVHIVNETLLTISHNKECRSCSPDIFDDEISVLDDEVKIYSDQEILTKSIIQPNNINNNFTDICQSTSKTNIILEDAKESLSRISRDSIHNNKLYECSEQKGIPNTCMPFSQNSETTKRKSDDFMDLTECIKTNNMLNIEKISTNLSEGNATKRKSNDLMELTKCVTAKDIDHIDLTQNNVEIDKEENKRSTENIDLTQSSNSNDELPFVSLSKNPSLDDTVILDENEYALSNKELREFNNAVVDLFEESADRKGNISIFDDFIHDHSDSSEEPVDIEVNRSLSNKITSKNIEKQIDLSQISSTSDKVVLTSNLKSVGLRIVRTPTKFNEIFNTNIIQNFDEYKHCESSSSKQREDAEIDLTQNCSRNNIENQRFTLDNDEYDLTQSSDEEMYLSNNKNDKKFNQSETHTPRRSKLTISVSNTLKENEGCVSNIKEDSCSMDLSNDTYKNQSLKTPLKSPRNSLGKKDNISVDYDEIYNNEEHASNSECIAFHNDKANDSVDSRHIESNCSQQSEVFEIIDNELDYSLNKSKRENFEIGGLSIINNISMIDNHTVDTVKDRITDGLPEIDIRKNTTDSKSTPKVTPNSAKCIKTPGNSEYIIKTDEVTPMTNYAGLSTPERNRELDKYGIKPMKRKRAIQLLTHLYNQTHPIVESTLDDLPTPSKKLCTSEGRLTPQHKLHPDESLSQKTTDTYENVDNLQKNSSVTPIKSKSPNKKSSQYTTTPKKTIKLFSENSKSSSKSSKSSSNNSKSPGKCSKLSSNNSKSPGKCSKSPSKSLKSQVGELSQENVYKVTSEVPCLKDIECEENDMVFQKREKAKVHSCRVPLHIAFHNYVVSRNGLREAILRYEPVNIDVIHKELVTYGHRYDPKDLLKFMDKKCITVKTSDNNVRN